MCMLNVCNPAFLAAKSRTHEEYNAQSGKCKNTYGLFKTMAPMQLYYL